MSDLSARLTDLSPVKQALVRRLAEGKAEASSVAGSGLVIPQLPGGGPFPLSYAQERVWFTSQLAPNVPLFNLAGGIRYPGVPDVAELEQRVTAAMRRHDVLRMSVQVIDDEPASLLVPATRVRVPVLDRSSADPADTDTIAREAVLEVGAAAYRLDEAPLWRVALVRLPGGERMLVMSAHHIILDGPSLARLGYELLVPQARPALPVRYADFAAWQKRSVRDGALADELDYWRGELTSLPPPLDLPISRPRPARRSLRGATTGAEVPGDLLRQVRQFSGDQKVTPFTVFLSAFIALLHRYTGLDDILVGTPLSGRPLPELHDLLGMFVNLVPLRVRLTSTMSFRELLAQANRTLTAAQARPGVPFEVLVTELGLGGSQSYPPLIQVGFNMPVPVVPPTVRLADVPYAPEGAQLDLTAQIMPRGADGLQVLFEFASDLFEESAIRRMIGQYLLLAKELTIDPGRAIGAIPLLSARDQAVLTAGSGPGGARHALEQPGAPGGLPPAPLHELVTAQVRRTPRNVAVLSGHRTLSYAELASRSDAVTAELRRRGVRTETLVGVYLGPGLDLPVALLAIWQAGGAYVPLDPGLPAARIEQILAESGVGVVLTRRDMASALPAAGHQVLCVDEIPAGPRPVPAAVSLANAAYVIHTSGSTGSPKGVIVTHGGIANRVLWTVRAHGLGSADRVLQRTRIGFDAAGWEVFAPLVSGGTVVMPAAGADSDPRALLEAVGDQQVTVLQVVPSILRALAEDGDWSRCGSLRLLLSAGEPLEGDLCARIRELTGAQIVNTYGPAECAIDATAATVDPAGHSGRVPIGRPIDNMRALVLDPAMRPVPVGLPGELYLGGIGVGRGYHGRPGLTAASFVADPYDPLGGRLYRTGDLARWREDGSLEFLGRRDHQVKISGVRVELGEIEIHLASHPAVREAVVTAPADGTGGRRLVAYVVGDASHHELRSFLRERLPAAMVPGIFRTLETLPRTVGGKVDRASLSSPDPSVRPADEAYLPPRDYTEQAIATVWAELLQVTRVSADDDFFALGGQSLLLIRLAGRLRTMFDVELSIADLFVAPTVQSQARLVAASRATALEPVQRASRAEPLPLSAGQSRLWFLHQMNPQDVSYNAPIAMLLSGELNQAALRAALDELVARHEVLRTTIQPGPDGAGRQVIQPSSPVRLAYADLTGMAVDQTHAKVRRLVADDVARPFDLTTGPVLRAQLIRLDPGRHVLCVTIHHIASDGWSAGLLRSELLDRYAALCGGARSPANPLPVQYADYASWQRRFLTSERVGRQLDYWRARLTGLPVLRLPTDRPRPARIRPLSGYCRVDIPAELADRLRAIGRRAGTTLFMTLLAGFQALLARYTGQPDIVVGTAIAGRTCPGTERLIGFFVNSLVLRTDLSGDPTVMELLARVRKVALGAYANQDVPFERLVEELQPERDLSRHPLYQIMFEMVTNEEHAPSAGLETEPLLEEMTGHAPKFDLTLWIAEHDDASLVGYVEYATDLFDMTTIEQMLRHFRAVLAGFAAEPGQRLSDIPMLSAAEHEQLASWAAGPADGQAAGELVPTLFTARARAAPDAVAVIADDRPITYLELDARANRLAHLLRARKVRPETIVGVCLPAGIDFIVAVLAVLKAGGAYLPLDPDDPASRIASMLSGAAAGMVITSSDLRRRLPDGPATVLALDDPAVLAVLSRSSAGALPVTVLPDNAAYVIFTSGSSGLPKAVLVEHRALACSVTARLRYYTDPVGTFLLLSPVAFDSSVAGIFWTLVTGGTLVIPRPGPKLADEIAGDALRHQVTHMLAVPSLLAQLADWLTRATAPSAQGMLGSVRVIITAGEACPDDLAERLSAMAPDAALANEYGPTEASVWATAASIEPGAAPLIGAPVAGVVVHVLDATLRPVPVGVAGELYLGGAALARGYLNQPGLTATRFVPNPLAGDGSRLYRTGDLASWRPDGRLAYHGRVDDQVKINGYRVEPGEVEAVLRAHPMVRQAVVTGSTSWGGDRQLVGYLVDADPACPVTDDELRRHCGARLPAYLIPALYAHLDALPLTGSGKVDRGGLPDPRAVQRGALRSGDAPRSAIEEQIAGIWQEILGGGPPGIHDDFFALGGHSLHAVRIAARLKELLDVELPVRRLFEATTIAGLAAVVEQTVAAEIAALSDEDVAALLAESDTRHQE